MARKAKLGGSADVAKHSDLMHGLMTSVIVFMSKTGMTRREIDRVFQASMAAPSDLRMRVGSNEDGALAYGCDTVAGAVLRAWHKFPKYLDESARPIPLRVGGPGLNLSSLISSQNKSADPGDVIQSMINSKLLTRHKTHYFLPAKDSATIESLDPLSVDHIAKTVMRLVETASRNVAKSKKKLSLIERYAHVPDLTKAEAKAFAAFSRQQGQACLDTIEDWLETRQVKKQSNASAHSKGVNAGVHIFAYLGDSAKIMSPVRKSKAKPRTTPSRAARA